MSAKQTVTTTTTTRKKKTPKKTGAKKTGTKNPKKSARKRCPKCGRPLVYRVNKKHKKFIACSGYPKCDYVRNEEEPVVEHKHSGLICPECGGELVERRHGKKTFLGCSNYPKCHHIEPIRKK